MASVEHKTHTEAVNIYILRSIQTIFTIHLMCKQRDLLMESTKLTV